jgi:pimeloyl-ACP methyl ester carboxylesterase
MIQKDISYSNKHLCYYTAGQGPVVVLIHGFGEDSSIWENQAAYLASTYCLIIPDIPGSGLSAPLEGNPSIEDFAAAVKAILIHENISSCTMLGHSMGGYIALAYAEKYPADLGGLGLIHSTAFADSDEKKAARAKSIDFILTNGAHAFLKTSIPGLFSNAFSASHPSIIASLAEKATAFNNTSIVAYYRAMINRPDRSGVLAALNKPVLFIAGIFDNAVPFEQSLRQFHLPQQAYIHVLRQSAHMGMLEETTATNKAITDYLEAVNC